MVEHTQQVVLEHSTALMLLGQFNGAKLVASLTLIAVGHNFLKLTVQCAPKLDPHRPTTLLRLCS